MKTYFISLVVAALIVAMIGILSPEGERGGIAKHLKLLTSLFLICVLISPLKSVAQDLFDLANGNLDWLETDDPEEDYRQQMNDALDASSKSYFTQMLTQTLQTQFSIESGELCCQIQWSDENDELKPTKVTVILSGKAIWVNPEKIESYVTELLGCECVTAIE